MPGVILRRVGQAVVTLTVGSVLVWSLLALAPGDPARRVLQANNVSHPTAEQVEAKRPELGLTGSPVARYGRWLAGVVRGDLGDSWVTGRPVLQELGSRLPATLRLTVTAAGRRAPRAGAGRWRPARRAGGRIGDPAGVAAGADRAELRGRAGVFDVVVVRLGTSG